MRYLLCASLVVGLSSGLLAEEKPSTQDEFDVRPSTKPMLAKTEGSEFSIDANLVDKMFESTTNEASATASGTDRVRFEAALGYMIPSEMSFQNDYFTVPYTENVSSISYGMLRVGKPFLQAGKVSFGAFGLVGYSYLQGIYEVESKDGLALKDTISLQWIPLQLGLTIDVIDILGNVVQPGLIVAGGADSFTQSGTLDGMNQSYWVPSSSFGLAFNFFGNGTAKESTFDGISLSGQYRTSYGDEQVFKGWTYNLATRFAM